MARAPEPERISSRANRLLVRARALAREPAAYRHTGEAILEGEHLCAAWLAQAARTDPPAQAIVSDEGWANPTLRQLATAAARVALVDRALMAGVSQLESPPSLVYLVALPAARAIEAGQPTVVLDGVQDPGNVGAVLRSAAAFGFTQAIALAGTAALWSPKVLRAGMGAHFGLRLVEAAGAEALAGLGLPCLGTSSHASEAIDSAALPWPCAWLFGSEGNGLSDAARAHCDRLLRIPQPGGEESLNVAAAAAVCLYESARQRRAAVAEFDPANQ